MGIFAPALTTNSTLLHPEGGSLRSLSRLYLIQKARFAGEAVSPGHWCVICIFKDATARGQSQKSRRNLNGSQETREKDQGPEKGEEA
jgi:hypothetical protein